MSLTSRGRRGTVAPSAAVSLSSSDESTSSTSGSDSDSDVEAEIIRDSAARAKPAGASAAKVNVEIVRVRLPNGVDTLSHLLVKRFSDPSELKPGARRDWAAQPHDAEAGLAPTGRAACRVCGEAIRKGTLRASLLAQCDRGYKNRVHMHAECLPKHPQAKLVTREEFVLTSKLTDKQLKQLDRVVAEVHPDKPHVQKTSPVVAGRRRGRSASGTANGGAGRAAGTVAAAAVRSRQARTRRSKRQRLGS